eukprot:8055031-Pyramimonas_sp.AAC.1
MHANARVQTAGLECRPAEAAVRIAHCSARHARPDNADAHNLRRITSGTSPGGARRAGAGYQSLPTAVQEAAWFEDVNRQGRILRQLCGRPEGRERWQGLTTGMGGVNIHCDLLGDPAEWRRSAAPLSTPTASPSP